MSSGVGTVGLASGVVSTPVVNSSALSLPPSHATTAAPASFNNPLIIQDPTAGFITEYLSANGSQVVSQTPSAITVAYLRTGLAADGTPKHSNNEPVSTSA